MKRQKRTLYEQQKRALTHTVTFYENGGTAVSDIPYVIDGYPIAEPSISRTAYDFQGWYTESTFIHEWDFSTPVTSNLFLYARWTPTVYTITYVLNGYINNPANPATYTIESPTITFANVLRDGYDTVWSPVSIPTGSFGNKTATASGFIAKTYTVTFAKEGGTGGTNSITVTFDSAVPSILSMPEKTGFDFFGYYPLQGGSGNKYYNWDGTGIGVWDIPSNTTLYAFYTEAGEALYSTPGTYSWTAPSGVTSVSAVCIGGGNSGTASLLSYNDEPSSYSAISGVGSGLAWKNNIAVVPGQTYTVVVGAGGAARTATFTGDSSGVNLGGASYFVSTSTVLARTGSFNLEQIVGDGGYKGGNSGQIEYILGNYLKIPGGGGSAGFFGPGGRGDGFGPVSEVYLEKANNTLATGDGAGGGGFGKIALVFNAGTVISGAGAGTSVYPDVNFSANQGVNGDFGNGTSGTGSGTFGGGGYSVARIRGSTLGPAVVSGAGQGGAVRIVWGQVPKIFPTTNV